MRSAPPPPPPPPPFLSLPPQLRLPARAASPLRLPGGTRRFPGPPSLPPRAERLRPPAWLPPPPPRRGALGAALPADGLPAALRAGPSSAPRSSAMDGAARRGVLAALLACGLLLLGAAATPTPPAPAGSSPQDTCTSCGFRRPEEPGKVDGDFLEAVKRHILSRLQMRDRPNITHAVPKAAMVTALRKLHAGKVREDGRVEIPSLDGQASAGPPAHDPVSEIISFAETGGRRPAPSRCPLPCLPRAPQPAACPLPAPCLLLLPVPCSLRALGCWAHQPVLSLSPFRPGPRPLAVPCPCARLCPASPLAGSPRGSPCSAPSSRSPLSPASRCPSSACPTPSLASLTAADALLIPLLRSVHPSVEVCLPSLSVSSPRI